MKPIGVCLAACAALALAACGSNNSGTTTHKLRVELDGAKTADCISPQAVGKYEIEAPGYFYVEPEAPELEIICNAKGYQETYASFEEVYNDGSAGDMAVGALAFGLIGLAVYASQDSVDSLPDRVTITMVPNGTVHEGSLAVAEYEKASETLLPVTMLAPAYTRAQPPTGAQAASAPAAATAPTASTAPAAPVQGAHGAQGTLGAAGAVGAQSPQSQEAKLRSFETRLKGDKARLAVLLNRYNKKAEFKTSSHQPGMRLNIKDVAKLKVVGFRQEGYIVRIIGNSGLAASWSDEVYDELFLIENRRGALHIAAHGQQLGDQMSARGG